MRLKRGTKTFPWDAADHLHTDEERVAYLDAALEEDDPLLVAAVLEDIARSKGMEAVLSDAGLAIPRSDEEHSANGGPELAAVMRVARSLGLRLTAASTTATDGQ